MKMRLACFIAGFVLLLGFDLTQGAEPVEITGRVVPAYAHTSAGSAQQLIALGGTRAVGSAAREVGGARGYRGRDSARPSEERRGSSQLSQVHRQGVVDAAGEPVTGVKVSSYGIETTFVSFTARPAGIAIASHRGVPSISLRLPPGDYGVRISGLTASAWASASR